MVDNQVKRSFIPGDEWLYYKIYTGRNTADLILVDIIKPISEELIKNEIISKWFFIRYGDPEFHLRVRFNLKDSNSIGIVIDSLMSSLKKFRDQEFIWKIQIDTYEREVERYDPNLMNHAEEIFYYDSHMIVDFIGMIDENEDANLRWLFALRAIDSFLTCFQFQDKDKLSFIEILKTDFGKEFGISGKYKRQIDKKYRNLRGQIDDFMTFTVNDRKDFAPLIDLLEEKNKGVQKIALTIIEQRNQGELKSHFTQILGGYIHMLMNRLFKSKNRQHEMVCYDFLYRYYRSLIAKRSKQAL